MRISGRSALLCSLFVLLGAAPAVAAPTVAEFPVPQMDTDPLGIATSPAGALMFAEGSTDAFGVSTVGGLMGQISGLSGPTAGVAEAGGDVWMTEPGANRIVRVSPLGGVSEFQVTRGGAMPEGITAGPDGNVWFTDSGNPGGIWKITSSGAMTDYTAGLAPHSDPTAITAGADGNLWFTDSANPGGIGRITPSGAITVYTAGLTPDSDPTGIAAGPDGNVWFTEAATPGRIGKITPSGTITQYTTGLTPDSDPTGIAAGPGGDLWFTEAANPGAIGWITPQGTIAQVPTPTADSVPDEITGGPGGAEWFTEDGDHGRLGEVTVPAPSSVTNSAIAVGATSAILTGTADPNGFSTTYHFAWGTTSGYGQTAPAADAVVGSGSSPQAVTQTLTGLTPSTVYHYRLVASNCGGCQSGTTDGSDMTFTTASAPPQTGSEPVSPSAPSAIAPPAIGHSAVAGAVAGTVLVRTPGSDHAQSLTAARDIPIGSLIDARKGRVDLTTEINHHGRTQSAVVWGGQFVLRQAGDRGMTTFRLAGGPVGCTAPGSKSRARAMAVREGQSKKPVSIWAHDHDGRYSTRGNNSVATVRGTIWKTTESCRGTVTFVQQGVVSVLDLHTRHAVLVRAGHSFLARP